MDSIYGRNIGISSETLIKCDGTFKSFRDILLENQLDYSDIEASGYSRPIKLKKTLNTNLTHSSIKVKEIYYNGYLEFHSIVLDNGIQCTLSSYQSLLITTENYNFFKSLYSIRHDEDLLIFPDNTVQSARILSRTSIGPKPCWTPFKSNNSQYILKSGLVLN